MEQREPSVGDGSRRRAVRPPELSDAQAIGYSHAIESNGARLLHIAGQVAEGATVAEQVERALESVGACCRAAGGSLGDVVSMTWYTTQPVGSVWASSAPARRRLLPDPPPAMTVVQVAGLADRRYQVEITGVAILAATE
jgi:2-iminobutanoate/2-iminopropanoate deaminase